MGNQNNISRDKPPETIDGQINFCLDSAAVLAEKVWGILDEYEISCDVKNSAQRESSEQAQAILSMFDSIHTKFFSLFTDALYSALAIKPHPQIQQEPEKIFNQWRNSQELNKRIVFFADRMKKFEHIIKQKTKTERKVIL